MLVLDKVAKLQIKTCATGTLYWSLLQDQFKCYESHKPESISDQDKTTFNFGKKQNSLGFQTFFFVNNRHNTESLFLQFKCGILESFKIHQRLEM